MLLLLSLLSIVIAQEIIVYVSPLETYSNGTRVVNVISSGLPFANVSRHVKFAKVKSQYGWEMIGDSGDALVYNKDTIKYKKDNCDYNDDPLMCSVKNDHYYVRTVLHLNKEEGLVSQTLYGKNGQVITSAEISNKKVINWIKQQEITVFEGGFHKPKEEMPLKWEIPYRIFNTSFEQVSFRLWSGVKLK